MLDAIIAVTVSLEGRVALAHCRTMLTELHSNLVPVHIIHGLAFFSMGLAVLLQWRRESRLPLAHALPALIVFAFMTPFWTP